jgi:hypothetical protein
MKRAIFRITVGIITAMMGVISVQVWSVAAQPSPSDGDECVGCHTIIHTNLEDSAHGLAGVDPVFVSAWTEQGQPNECMACHATGYDPETGTWESEGVACKVCHSPIPSDHPDQVMPTNVSSRLCGDCHIDTFSQLEVSTHGKEGLTCVRCHNSHTTSLKTAGVQDLCEACHKEQTHFFSYTSHYAQGLLCTDCHLSIAEGVMGDGHGRRQHTFTADLETCTECHGEGLHYPTGEETEAVNPEDAMQAGMIAMGQEESLALEPNPVSPVGFAVLASLVGMAAGMLLAPWLERWYKSINR